MNPSELQWRSWSPEAFEEAARENKPIFLSISAVWCHWCHVLDDESFSHPEIIRRLNRDYIPIRVDSDKRPDINARYNMGGWPTVAVLDADGLVKIGGTYMPPGQLLSMLSEGHKRSSLPISRPVKPNAPGPSCLDGGPVSVLADYLERIFDRDFGGFGGPPKFPQPWVVDLLFHLHRRTGEDKWQRMAALTLDGMREGELYDPVDGGFFRYATSTDWDRPHYEKLLEVNAQMLSLYLKAFNLTGELRYRATAKGVLDYLMINLVADPAPWFYGSQSADAEYYSLSEEEKITADPPFLDRSCYTDRNGMAASALLMAYFMLEDDSSLDRALKLVNFLWEGNCSGLDGMVHDGTDGSSLCGYLSDQVYMMSALLDAYEATGEARYLTYAQDLVRILNVRLWDAQEGAFWDLPDDPQARGILRTQIKPFTENAVAALSFIRLSYLSGGDEFRIRGETILKYLASVFPSYKVHAAPFGVALERFLCPPLLVTVVGPAQEPKFQEFLHAAHRLKNPWKVVLPLDCSMNEERIRALGYSPSDRTRAYVCQGTVCLPVASRPEELALPSSD